MEEWDIRTNLRANSFSLTWVVHFHMRTWGCGEVFSKTTLTGARHNSKQDEFLEWKWGKLNIIFNDEEVCVNFC